MLEQVEYSSVLLAPGQPQTEAQRSAVLALVVPWLLVYTKPTFRNWVAH